VHPLRVQPELLDRPFAHPLADHDDLVGPPCGAVVSKPPEEPLASREQLRQIEVLYVEERQDGRTRHPRDRNRERIVHHVGCLELGSESAWTDSRRRHRTKPSCGCRGGAVLGRHDRRNGAASIRGEGRHERLVRVTSHARESVCKLTHVRFAPARNPRDERQHAEGDTHQPAQPRPATSGSSRRRAPRAGSAKGRRRSAPPRVRPRAAAPAPCARGPPPSAPARRRFAPGRGRAACSCPSRP
jgi:hypothetical protein